VEDRKLTEKDLDEIRQTIRKQTRKQK
jgi:hypothetical protein